MKFPFDPETVFRTEPVSTFRAVTATFGIIAPEVSATVPLIDPVALCPSATETKAIATRKQEAKRFIGPSFPGSTAARGGRGETHVFEIRFRPGSGGP